ncbi:hypothetical protein SAMN05216266_107203 [Amycolatopsis marina]|uniref:Secreted protein n=1 Tax=Amycolatopsis marina TaxID=490629 RepID=A0A1I0ZTX5_9PSEU|nr:hypothetical protein [Amycolatopsis marina]SFB27900.1 hypothetical protein SAMN05216266_107203 [Amycolatopsis marina]
MNRRVFAALGAAVGLTLGLGTAVAHADSSTEAFLEGAPSITVSATSASGDFTAAAECYFPVVSPDRGALVCFNPYGEHLYICDNAPDGHHPAARYYRSDKSGLKVKHAAVKSGNCYDHNLSIPESGWVNYQACNYEKDTRLSCSSFSGRISAG